MPSKLYRIHLSQAEREELVAISEHPKSAKEKRKRANILLMADEGDDGPGFIDSDIATALGCTSRTVERIRAACFEAGPSATVARKKREHPPRPRLLDGRGEAELVKIACSSPPAGHSKWSLRLLAGRVVALEVVEDISHTTVGNTLKKTRSNPG